MTTETVKTKLGPPDGGWGWIVLTSALVVNFLIPGTVKSFGVLFVEFLHVFKASPTAASWMPALCYFLYNSLGPLSSFLSDKYSYKTVTIIGGAFASCGMMLSYFANSVSYLYVSYGLMVGIGAGLTFPPTVYIVTAYFEKLRGLANGLCISGSAIGTIVLPPFLQYLLDCFGYRGAVLIMGAITLNTIVCGLLYHPVEQHMISIPIKAGIDNEALTIDKPSSEQRHQTKDALKFTQATDDTDSKQSQIVSQIVDSRTPCSDNETVLPNEMNLIQERSCQIQNIDRNIKENYDVTEEEGTLEDQANEIEKKDNCDANDRQLDIGRENNWNGQNRNSLNGENNISDSNIISNKLNMEKSNLKKYSQMKNNKNDNTLENLEDYLDRLSKQSAYKVSTCTADREKKLQFFDLGILKDPIYLIILISNSTSAISNTNFMILLPSYAIAEGFDKNSSALLLSIVSVFDLVGRIGGASLSDIDFVPKYYYFVVGLGTSGLALALLPMATSYTMLSFFCALFGLSSGMYIGITTVILADMLGTEKLSSSYGISLFVNGVLQLLGPPVCGIIYETIGSYKPIFLSFGIILILGTSLWALVPLIKRNKKKDLQVV